MENNAMAINSRQTGTALRWKRRHAIAWQACRGQSWCTCERCSVNAAVPTKHHCEMAGGEMTSKEVNEPSVYAGPNPPRVGTKNLPTSHDWRIGVMQFCCAGGNNHQHPRQKSSL